MVEKPKKRIHIDLNQFKLHIELPHIPALTLQFDSPSRKFYLSVIALVVHKMKRLERITSIPLEEHLELLGLLNETVGGSAGSSQSAHLLPRIYRKWKDALPDLEDAPLFKVLGRKRDFEEGIGATYQFTNEEKDAWANLFEYRGSEEHVRLRFSIDKLSASLDDVVIAYGEDPELIDDAAWNQFIEDLRQEAKKQKEHIYEFSKERDIDIPLLRNWKGTLHRRWKWSALACVIAIVAAFFVWKYARYDPQKEGTTSEKMAFPLPDKPSIAVLPFVNMSGDPKQEYFSDGITEEIITALSKVEKLFVIASSSVFTYKGKAVKVQQVAEDLGVQYVLEGSIRKAEDTVRITAQLVDAQKGNHIWGERYDRDLKDLFELQDEITMKIITTLEVTLTEGEQALIAGSGTDNLDAYLKILQARDLARHQSIEDNHKARRFAEEAIALDPGYAQAYRWLGGTHYMDMWLGSSKSAQESLRKAVEFAQKAIFMNDSLGGAHGLLGNIYIMRKEYEKGIREAQRAVELEPNGADAHAFLGMGLRFADRAEEAVPFLQKAIQLDPHASGWYMHVLAGAYRNLEKFDEAIKWGEKAVQHNPKNIVSRISLCSIYSQSGLMDKAREQAGEIMRLNPDFSIKRFARTIPQKNKALKQKYLDSLRKAGLPYKPAQSLPDKPSIAVLPFKNMSGDPKQEYFSDGITEEIITALSKVEKLFVIASSSVFTYKGKAVKVQQVAEDLGVQYVLEGSVRKAEDTVRITAQLVDAQTGHHLWAERYDKELKNIFALQDEITFKVITALQVKLTEGEQARITTWGTDNFEAYAKLLQGIEYIRRFNGEGNLLARKMAEEVIALDPGYPQGYGLLGRTHVMDVWFGLSKSPRKSLAESVRLFQKVIAMHPSAADTRGLLGLVYTMMRQHEEGIAELEKAIALNPNVADNHAWFGFVLHLNGRHKEALMEIKKAIRLNPFPRSFYFMYLGNAYMYERMYDESIAAYKKALRIQPNNLFPHLRLAAVYSLLDRAEEACAEAAEVLRINPKFSLERFAKTIPFKNQSNADHLINALRKAGLK